MPRGQNLTTKLRRKAVATLVASGRAHRYTSEEARAAGAKGGKVSARVRRLKAITRTADALLEHFEDRLDWLEDARDRKRLLRLLAIAWRKGHRVGLSTCRKQHLRGKP